jgi:predicted N-acyltransferase
VQLRVLDGIDEVEEKAWDALQQGDDEEATPFTRHAWLSALERSGCAQPETGWTPCHLTLQRGSELIAAAPAYLKTDSEGDFARDWHWADAAQRAGIRYYPKLCLTVPFTPVTGRRLLVKRGESRPACLAELLEGVEALAHRLGAASLHVLFPPASEAIELEQLGLTQRVSYQYHWRNDDYASPEAFLARFDSKRRNQARRERRAPSEQGIAIRTVRGDELKGEWAKWSEIAFALHRSTVDKLMWGRRWLNRAFYDQVFSRMPEELEVVAAERDGHLVAGAFNVATKTHLYGRYWGCFEEHPFLHFNVCLYHSIDECIRSGRRTFEGGAGGEHKLVRGFEPSETYSAHRFFDARLQAGLTRHIAAEVAERAAELKRWRAASPILKHKTAPRSP